MVDNAHKSDDEHAIDIPGEADQDAAWARAEAQAASFDLDQQKAKFLAMVSHEIRTPLNGIIGMGKLLTDTKLTPEQRNYVEAMTSSSQALLLLVNDLLEFGQQQSGDARYTSEHLDIRNCVAGVAELLAGRAHEKGIELGWRVLPEVPDIVCTNAVALRQVLFNLTGNAVKFTETGGVSIIVCMCEDDMCLTISDSGPGIPDSDREAIFEPFHQLDMTHTRSQEGAGLGLAISKRLVADLNGDISLTDADGGGAQFHVRLPVKAIPKVFEAPTPFVPINRHVHIAMDDGPESNLLGAMLSDAGMALSDEESADTVFLDMRRYSGSDKTMERLWEHGDKHIMCLIEPHQRGTFGAAAKANGHGYLTRPVRETSLLRLLGNQPNAAEEVLTFSQKQSKTAPGKLRILLIEDNEINAMLATRMLEKAGHSVSLAADGSDALKMFAPGLFDIVVTDLHMPQTSGLQVVSSIRRVEDDDGAAPVVVFGLTADESEDTRKRFFEVGAQAVLSKPFEVQQFTHMATRCGLL